MEGREEEKRERRKDGDGGGRGEEGSGEEEQGAKEEEGRKKERDYQMIAFNLKFHHSPFAKCQVCLRRRLQEADSCWNLILVPGCKTTEVIPLMTHPVKVMSSTPGRLETDPRPTLSL